MNDIPSVLDLQVGSIVGSLRRQQEERCRQLIREAEREAEMVLRQNRRSLYDRGRDAINEERVRREKALLQARHRIRAAEGQRTQARYSRLLSDGWPELTNALVSRWSDPEGRNAWCEMLLREALAAFGKAPLRIEHPSAWSTEDSHRVGAFLDSRSVPAPALEQVSAIVAGLRIHSGSAVLDGTIDGLLADRAAVEGRLLAAWEDDRNG